MEEAGQIHLSTALANAPIAKHFGVTQTEEMSRPMDIVCCAFVMAKQV
jgi:hypothetical protein